jgi:type I restriction enzyme, S subunit
VSGFSVMSKEPSIIWAADRLINKRIDSNYYHIKYIEYLDTIVNCGLDCKPFEDICKRMNSGPFGSALLASAYVEKGVPFIRPLNCKNFIVEDNELVFISNEDSIRLKSSRFNSGALIITKIGNGIGDVAIIPRKNDKCNISGNLMGVEIKNSYDNYFVLSFLKSKYGQNQIWQGMMNSAKPKIDMDTIRSIQIPIPSAEIQKYIGDKVRRAEELREEAKRLKEEAESLISNSINLERLVEKVRDYKSKNNWVDSASISGRIDGQYYINPITEINKYMKNIDMKLVVLRDIAEVRKGFSYSNESSNGVPYIRISDLDDLLIDYSKVVRIDNKTYQQKRNSQLKYFDLIMAITGATIGKVSVFYNKEIEKATLSADTAYVRFNNIEDSIAYLLYFKTVIGQLAITQGITGATNKHLAIEDIKNIVLPQFEDSIKKEVKNKIVQSMDNIYTSKQLIQEAKQDVEDLIEGNFEMSKLNNDSSTESRC